MFTVISVNKEGNRIVNYTCAINNSITILNKDELKTLIKQGRVSNARIQNYKGSEIIRVKEIPGALGKIVTNIDRENRDRQRNRLREKFGSTFNEFYIGVDYAVILNDSREEKDKEQLGRVRSSDIAFIKLDNLEVLDRKIRSPFTAHHVFKNADRFIAVYAISDLSTSGYIINSIRVVSYDGDKNSRGILLKGLVETDVKKQLGIRIPDGAIGFKICGTKGKIGYIVTNKNFGLIIDRDTLKVELVECHSNNDMFDILDNMEDRRR